MLKDKTTAIGIGLAGETVGLEFQIKNYTSYLINGSTQDNQTLTGAKNVMVLEGYDGLAGDRSLALEALKKNTPILKKHLYPVTEKQYERLTELQDESSAPLSEDAIMDVINAVEYKQDGWNPWNYHRGLCGVGYSGCNDVDYTSTSYYKWKNMVQRCYDKKVHKKYKPEYKDKSVCKEWLNYSNFKIWFDEHYVPCKNNQTDLDKDLLVQGNKVYSPETCVLLLHYQNTMFEGRDDCIYENEDGTYCVDKKKSSVYDTYEEALDVVATRRQEKIQSNAEKCKGSIPMCAYEAMLHWDVRLAMCG